MDIREALGDNVRIVFHDKKGRTGNTYRPRQSR